MMLRDVSNSRTDPLLLAARRTGYVFTADNLFAQRDNDATVFIESHSESLCRCELSLTLPR